MTTTSTRFGSAKVTLPSDREILITRQFDAPAALIFECWTKPEHVRNWFGWDTSPLVLCEIDLRVGGQWRYVANDEHGTEFGWHGTYREIEPAKRLVSTEVFEGYPDGEALNTLTFAEVDGVTTLQALVLHQSKENRDGHIQSGMEGGMQHTMDRLERLLDSLTTAQTRP